MGQTYPGYAREARGVRMGERETLTPLRGFCGTWRALRIEGSGFEQTRRSRLGA